jgi:general secretion pathway protein D
LVDQLEQRRRRPFDVHSLVWRSGEAANLDINRERTYLTTQTDQQTGLLQPGSVQVQSGIEFRMTPTVLPGNQVRVDMHVEESAFIPAEMNVASERDANIAESSMQVASGQTIVIGGLMLDRSTDTDYGIPLLHRIPILKYLFGSYNRTGRQMQVVIFVTPRIWDPTLDAPLVAPQDFKFEPWMKIRKDTSKSGGR